jgi:hypothetical protein
MTPRTAALTLVLCPFAFAALIYTASHLAPPLPREAGASASKRPVPEADLWPNTKVTVVKNDPTPCQGPRGLRYVFGTPYIYSCSADAWIPLRLYFPE